MTVKLLLRYGVSMCLILGLIGSVHADTQGKIIDGTIAPANKYPSTVSLLNQQRYLDVINGNLVSDGVAIDQALYQSHQCAGTLIAPQWVLTSAGCVFGFSGEDLLVLYGAQTLEIADTDNLPDSLPGQPLGVLDVIIHPDYDFYTKGSALALLRIDSPSVDLDTVPEIYQGSLAATDIQASADSCDNSNNCGTIVGWGATDPVARGQLSPDLIETQVPLVSDLECNSIITNATDGSRLLPENMFCAGFVVGGKGICNGDNGGALFMSASGNPQADDFQIAGIASFRYGGDCAQPNLPDVYVRVNAFTDFIEGYTQGVTSPDDVPEITTNVDRVLNVAVSEGLPQQVVDFDATDGDNDLLTWSVVEPNSFNSSAPLFDIDSNGVLRLIRIPDEIDNPYLITVKVSDGQEGAAFAQILVALTDDSGGTGSDDSLANISISTVNASPKSVTADNSTASLVTVELRNTSGDVLTVSDYRISILATGSARVGAVANDGDGIYTASITNAVAETVTVSAAITGVVDLKDTDTVTFVQASNSATGSGGGGSTGWIILGLLGLTVRARCNKEKY